MLANNLFRLRNQCLTCRRSLENIMLIFRGKLIMKTHWGKLMVVGVGLLLSGVVHAQNWTQTSAPSNHWQSVASSADGSKLIALADSWTYYTSTNSGYTWTSNREPQSGSLMGSWYAIASSADGNKLAAITKQTVFTSTNAGISWTSNNVPGGTNLISVASSADGAKLVVAVGATPQFNVGVDSGFIYISTDSGATWTQSGAPNKYWSSVASSSDGTKLVAATIDYPGNAGWIYTSTNSGASWTQTSAPTNVYWVSVSSSADGSKLAAVNYPTYTFIGGNLVWTALGLVYTSTDSGATWVSNNVPNNIWQAVASSADGTKLVAIPQGGGIFTSTDSGATWTSNNVTAFPYWAVASSADGNKQWMVVGQMFSSGYIYTSQTTPSPQLNLTPSSTNFTLAWTIPSTNFGLQQSTDLVSWAEVTNAPVLNLTNLQHQVTLPLNGDCGFYRLGPP